jgi:hypothetical protein
MLNESLPIIGQGCVADAAQVKAVHVLAHAARQGNCGGASVA